jgi:uncharacterized protein (DUF2461 family)
VATGHEQQFAFTTDIDEDLVFHHLAERPWSSRLSVLSSGGDAPLVAHRLVQSVERATPLPDLCRGVTPMPDRAIDRFIAS